MGRSKDLRWLWGARRASTPRPALSEVLSRGGGDRIDSLHFRGSADSQGPQDVEGTSGGEVQGSRDLAHHGWEVLTLT